MSESPQYYYRGKRHPVRFDRIVIPKFSEATTTVMRDYGLDIRQVLLDNAIQDMNAEIDHVGLLKIVEPEEISFDQWILEHRNA